MAKLFMPAEQLPGVFGWNRVSLGSPFPASGGFVMSNPVRIAIVAACAVALFYLVVTLARNVPG